MANYTKEQITKVYEEVVNMINSAGDNYDADLREDYSGRGMYGKSVPAIVTDALAVLVGVYFCWVMDDFGTNYEDFDADDAIELCPLNWDEMGRTSMVYYDKNGVQ